jgi:hypothetical protein
MMCFLGVVCILCVFLDLGGYGDFVERFKSAYIYFWSLNVRHSSDLGLVRRRLLRLFLR